MAYKTRRCDKVLAKPAAPPRKEVCPICKLPGLTRKEKPGNCTFFVRCRNLKMSDDEKESARLRSARFRAFHAEICDVCRMPKDCCMDRKISAYERMVKKLHKEGSRDDTYITGEEITEMLKEPGRCAKPDQSKFTPVIPDWYTE